MDVEKLPPFPKPPLTIAVSQCLAGAHVRYDGGHKREAMPHAALDGLYVFRPICPEVGIGLGVPRDPIRLVGDPSAPRARVFGEKAATRPPSDVTDALRAYADSQLPVLDEVDGYVFMQNSPSCGLSGVKLFRSDTKGTGRAQAPGTPRSRERVAIRSHTPRQLCDAHLRVRPLAANARLRHDGGETHRLPHCVQIPGDGPRRTGLPATRTSAVRPARCCRQCGQALCPRFAAGALTARFPGWARQRIGASAGMCPRSFNRGNSTSQPYPNAGACRSD